MNDRDWGERFSRDVDVLLRGGEPAGADGAPAEYREMLGLAGALGEIDSSGASTIRQPLRRRLLAEAAQQPAAGSRQWAADWGRVAWGRVALLVPMAVVTLVAVGLLAGVLERAWPRGAPGSMGALVLTASPTLVEHVLAPSPGLVATPHLAPLASSTPVPAPTAGGPSAAAAWPPVGTLPVVPAEARTATGRPTRPPPTTSDLR